MSKFLLSHMYSDQTVLPLKKIHELDLSFLRFLLERAPLWLSIWILRTRLIANEPSERRRSDGEAAAE